jgi:hypothetical protein
VAATHDQSVIAVIRSLSSEEAVERLHLSGPKYSKEVHSVLQKCYEEDPVGLWTALFFLVYYSENVVAVGSLLSEITSYQDPMQRERILSALDCQKWGLDENTSDSVVLSTWICVYVEHFINC